MVEMVSLARLRRGACLALGLLAFSACGKSTKPQHDNDASAGEGGETTTSQGGSSGTPGTGGSAAASGRGTGGSSATGGKGGSMGVGGSGGTGADSTGGMGALSGTGGSSGGSPPLGPPSSDFLPLRTTTFQKLDLLLMVDNSISMADKQQLLAASVPNLMRHLTQPDCIGSDGQPTGTAADANGACADGEPEFAPVSDLHLGVITSSLGDHGSNDVCSDAQNIANQNNGGTASNYNDFAQLLGSVRSGIPEFLSWGPGDNASNFMNQATQEVTAAGEHGCGYEASLEAWYRFLVDPEPLTSIGNDMTVTVRNPSYKNSVLLAERAAFLRDDSVLGIVVLSDENDCSISDEDGQQGWLVGYKGGVGQLTWHMPRSTSVCQTNPNDACCAPCVSPPAIGCPNTVEDPACSMPNLSFNEDSMNLRCWAQKRRFGIDLLYPTSRYVEALTSIMISPRSTSQSPTYNPLFEGHETGVIPRSPAEVVFMALVGVPWQDLSDEDSWSSDRNLTYLTPEELAAKDRWSVILGDPAANVLPTDTLMVESVDPRTSSPFKQTHPLLPSMTIGSASATSNTNPINGHEQNALAARDDLQFACIFPLDPPISPADCDANADACDCNVDEFVKNSPLCQGTTTSAAGSQVYGKAYPGLRELEVVKGIGSAGIAASICPKVVTPTGSATTDPAFGYNPAMAAFAHRLAPKFTPMCLPVSLPLSASDPAHTACHVVEIEANPVDGNSCDCALYDLANATAGPTARAYDVLRARRLCSDEAFGVPCEHYCVCEIPELTGDALTTCQTSVDATNGAAGYCYVDPAQGVGSLDAVTACPPANKRTIRFSGGLPTLGGAPFVDCAPEDQ